MSATDPPMAGRNTVARLRKLTGTSGPRRRRRLRLRDWRVRTKLAAVLTIPALGLTVMAGTQANTSIHRADELELFAHQVTVSQQVAALVRAMQRERDHTAGTMAIVGIAATAAAAELDADRRATDQAVEALRRASAPLFSDPKIRPIYNQATSSLQGVRDLRTGVQTGLLRPQATFEGYSRIIADLLALLPQVSGVSIDAHLSETVRAGAELARAIELTSQIRARLHAAATAGMFTAEELDAFIDVRSQRQLALDQFRAQADAGHVARYADIVRGDQVQTTGQLEQIALEQAHGSIGLDPRQWWQASSATLELMHTVEHTIIDEAATAATAHSDAARRNTLLSTALVMLTLLVASLASWLIGRSMARSLRALRDEANNMAQRLPEVVNQLRTTTPGRPAIELAGPAVDSDDEIGEVAQALTAAHHSAVRLASEEAAMRGVVNAMFVNLARRSQNLVERQLELLDTLEAAETDPDQLANLFRLDHLAARMRRNDENLLVLAGGEGSRRWPEPVPLASVMLGALAEIEQYPRVRHTVADDIYVVGHAVADVVHLLAELLENATMFSAPQSLVHIRGCRAPDGDGALVTITDSGLGMTTDGLAQAHALLTAPTTIDLAAAERMGLIVVGRLAARHQIRVELRAPAEGLIAQVLLPGRILTVAPAEDAGVRTGRRAIVTDTPTAELKVRPPVATTPPGTQVATTPPETQVATEPPEMAAPAAPVAVDTSPAGLPIRVPAARNAADRAPATPHRGVDPEKVSTTLSQLYGGLRRAAAEKDEAGND